MTREEATKHLENMKLLKGYSNTTVNGVPLENVIDGIIALLKAQEPSDDWISRNRLKNVIQYYIDEAGWGDDVNKVLGWCLEFIDNQEAVKWE